MPPPIHIDASAFDQPAKKTITLEAGLDRLTVFERVAGASHSALRRISFLVVRRQGVEARTARSLCCKDRISCIPTIVGAPIESIECIRRLIDGVDGIAIGFVISQNTECVAKHRQR